MNRFNCKCGSWLFLCYERKGTVVLQCSQCTEARILKDGLCINCQVIGESNKKVQTQKRTRSRDFITVIEPKKKLRR